jgi:hypothetical protein
VDITVKGRDWQAWTNSSKTRLADAKGDKEVESDQSWQEQLGNGDKTFISSAKSGSNAKVLSNYASGAQTLAITLAANQSMKSGKPAKVAPLL